MLRSRKFARFAEPADAKPFKTVDINFGSGSVWERGLKPATTYWPKCLSRNHRSLDIPTFDIFRSRIRLLGFFLGQRIEGLYEDRAGFLRFCFAGSHKFPQNGFAFGGDTDEHEAAVTFAAFAVNEIALLQAVDQFDCTVMTQGRAVPPDC